MAIIKNLNPNRFFLAVIVALPVFGSIFTGCNGHDTLASTEFYDQCWRITDTLSFDYSSADPSEKQIDIYLNLGPDYSYSNLYLKLFFTDPQGNTEEIIVNDTLLDAEGNWLGEYADWTFSSAPKISLSSAGTYQFSLIQYMREEKLCDIHSVGVNIR